VLISVSQMLTRLAMPEYNERLAKIMQQHPSPEVRSAMIIALHQLTYSGIESIIRKGMNDKDGAVRTTAIGLLNELNLTAENLPGIVDPIFKKGSLREQQQLIRVLGEMPVEKSAPVLEKLIDQLRNNALLPGLTLELVEAVDSTHSSALISKLEAARPKATDPLDVFREALYGGDRRRGANTFYRNSTAQCVRCHAIGEQGGTVGPPLGNIGNVLTREQLLQALVEPSARLSPGYGNVTLTLTDGQVVSGVLIEETAKELTIKTSEAEPMEVAVSRITKRENLPSSMPPMGTLLSKREIRDMVEFLSNLKNR
jgi:quinoprotein glucose dehydrogenase